jgi:methylthioribose-1-phosphate isomerase
MRTGQVDAVLFGADRVAANGDIANKIGTYKLAVVARENNIPVFAVVPTSTVDLNLADGDQIPIEERGAEEVTTIDGAVIAPAGVAGLQPSLRRDAAPLSDGDRHRGGRLLSAL